MSILVCSNPKDIHCQAICWGLDRLSAKYFVWSAREFPRSQEISTFASKTGLSHFVNTDHSKISLDDIKTVWLHRMGKPNPSRAVDIRDVDFVKSQCATHLTDLLHSICPSAFWVNSFSSYKNELSKMSQLDLAQRSGFNIPKTLFSNSPKDVRDFFHELGTEIVHKSYRLGVWLDENGKRPLVNYTNTLSADDINNDASISAAPSIFQEKIDKSQELRVTIFGSTVVAASIQTGDPHSNIVDSRAHPRDQIVVSQFDLPGAIHEKCLEFMDLSNLNFSCLDIIIDRSGDYYFLESNQMGQFLWIEEQCPEIPMLDTMCNFLISRNSSFLSAPNSPLRYHDFLDEKKHK